MGTVRKAGAAAVCGPTSAFPFVIGDGLSLCSPPEKRLKSEETPDGRAGQRPGSQAVGTDVCRASCFSTAAAVSRCMVENASASSDQGNHRLENECANDLRRVDVHALARDSCGGNAHGSPSRTPPAPAPPPPPPPPPPLLERNYLDCVSRSPVCNATQTQPERKGREMTVLCKLEPCSPPGPNQDSQHPDVQSGNQTKGPEAGIGFESTVSLTMGYGGGSNGGYGGRTSVEGERNFISGFGERRLSPNAHHHGVVGTGDGAGRAGAGGGREGAGAAAAAAAGVAGGGEESPKSSVDSQSGESCPMPGAAGVEGEPRGGGGEGGRGNLSSPGSMKEAAVKMSSNGSAAQSGGNRVGLTMTGRPPELLGVVGGIVGHMAVSAAPLCQGARIIRMGNATSTATLTPMPSHTSSILANGQLQHYHLHQQKPAGRDEPPSLQAAHQLQQQQQQLHLQRQQQQLQLQKQLQQHQQIQQQQQLKLQQQQLKLQQQQQQVLQQPQGASANICVPFCSVCSMAAPLTPPAPAWKANDSKSEEERQQRAKNLLCSVEGQRVIDFLSENRFKIRRPDRPGGQDGGAHERLRVAFGVPVPLAAARIIGVKVEPSEIQQSEEVGGGLAGLRAYSEGAAAAAMAAAAAVGVAACGARSPSSARALDMVAVGRRSADGAVAVGPSSTAEGGTNREREREMMETTCRAPTATGYSRSAESVPARSGGSISDDRSHSEVLQSVERMSRSRTRSPAMVVLARCDGDPGVGRAELLPVRGGGPLLNNGTQVVTISSMVAGFLQSQSQSPATLSSPNLSPFPQHQQQQLQPQLQQQQQEARSTTIDTSLPMQGCSMMKPTMAKYAVHCSPAGLNSSPTSSSNKEQNGPAVRPVVGSMSGTTERSSADGRLAATTGQSSPDCSTTTGGGAAVVDEQQQEHQCKEAAAARERENAQQHQDQLKRQREGREEGLEEEQEGNNKKGCSAGRQFLQMNMNAGPAASSAEEDMMMTRRLREGGGGGGAVEPSFQRAAAESDRSPGNVPATTALGPPPPATGGSALGAQPRLASHLCSTAKDGDASSRAGGGNTQSPPVRPPTTTDQEKVSVSVAYEATGSPSGRSTLAERPGISLFPTAGCVSSAAAATAAAASLPAATQASPPSRRQRRGVALRGGQRGSNMPGSKKKGRPAKSLLEITICSRKKNPLTGKMMVKETGAAKKKIQKIKELLWDIVEIVLGPKEVIKPADVDKALAVVLERGIGGAQARNIVKLLPEKNPGSTRAMREDFLKIIRQDFTNARMAAGPVARGGLKQKTLKELKNLDTHGVLSCSWSGIYLCRKADEHNDRPFLEEEDHEADGGRVATCTATAQFERAAEWGGEEEEKKPERVGEGERSGGGLVHAPADKASPSVQITKCARMDPSCGSRPSNEIVIGLQSPVAMMVGGGLANLAWVRGGENGVQEDGLERKGLNLNQMVHA